jgi:hypothetical protein
MKRVNTFSRFQRGSGVYTCVSCARKTRATGNKDNENIGLCVEYFEIAGLENQISDSGDADGSLAKKIAHYTEECISKGGKLNKTAPANDHAEPMKARGN